MNKLNAIMIMSVFLISGLLADSNTTTKVSTKFQESVLLELYKQLKEADEIIDSSFLPILEKMQKNDGVISVSELKDEFWDDLISQDFIKGMQSNPILKKWIQYEMSDDELDKLLADTTEKLKKAKQYQKEAEQYQKIGEEADKNAKRYKENAERYKKAREKLWG